MKKKVIVINCVIRIISISATLIPNKTYLSHIASYFVVIITINLKKYFT